MLRVAATVATLACCCTAEAHADWLFTPFIGSTFHAETTYVDLEGGTETPQLILGGSAAWLTRDRILGAEADFSYAPRFFETDNRGGLVLRSNITTLTAGLIAAAPLSLTRESLRPYLAAGAGLIHAGIEDVKGIATIHDNLAGLTLGGGAIGFISPRTGFRFDLRQFRSFNRSDDQVTGVRRSRLRLWRATVGVTLRY